MSKNHAEMLFEAEVLVEDVTRLWEGIHGLWEGRITQDNHTNATSGATPVTILALSRVSSILESVRSDLVDNVVN